MADSQAILSADPEILGGELVFAGTRVPVRSLLEYLGGGQTLAEFLADFPSVSRQQARRALELAGQALAAGASAP